MRCAVWMLALSLSLLLGAAGTAQAGSAGAVADACKLKPKTPEQDQFRFMACTNLIRGFLDGYQAGARHGLTMGFLDPKNQATVENQRELKSRLDLLLPEAECVPRAIKPGQLEFVYVKYFTTHPAVKEAAFADVMVLAIENHFCPNL